VAKQYTGWAYVSGSGNDVNADGPVGAVQYHADGAGSISGSKELLFVTSSSPYQLRLTGSLHVSGTITALNYDVVNHTVTYFSSSGDSKFGNSIDDLQEFTGSVQTSGAANSTLFRVDGGATSPVIFATGSGRVAIGHDSPNYALSVNGYMELGNGSGLGYVVSRGDVDTYLKFHNDSIALVAGNNQLLTLDENGTDKVILGSSISDITYISGNFSVCEGTASIAHLSGCSPIQVHAPISSSYNISASSFYGDGSNLTGVPDITGTPANNEIAVWTDADTLEGEGKLTFDGSVLTVTADVSASGKFSATSFYGDFYGNSLINNSGHLTIQNEVADKKIINKLGSTDSNTSFQIRASDNTAHFAVDGAGTVVVTPTGILQISSAGVLSSSANLSASNFYVPPGNSIFFDGSSETFKITNNGTNLDINGANINLNATTTTLSGDLSVCAGTASIAHLSGCSPIQVHAPMQIQSLDEGGILFAGTDGELSTDVDNLEWSTDRDDNDGYLSLFVSSSASGSAALGDGMFMVTDENDDDICFISADGAEFAVGISASANVSASYFYGDGSNLTNLPGGGGGGGIFTELGATTAATTSSVKIGTGSAPMITLDVHYTGSSSPVNLSNDTGGGEVVYYGGSGGPQVAGGIYYLNSSGDWASVDSATTGSGHNQLLGIALGMKPSADGILIKGYFDVHTHYSGSFIKGGPVYIQSSSVGRTATGGGYLSGAAPSAGDSYVRVVGYGTDTANVIYFNPDSTYVELV